MTDERGRPLPHGRHSMNVATFNHDGTIHMVAMWYGFSMARPSSGPTAVAEDPQPRAEPAITLLVEAGDEYEELHGRGTGGARSEIHPMTATRSWRSARRSWPAASGRSPMSPAPLRCEHTGAKRFGVRIKVERTVSRDHHEDGGRVLSPGRGERRASSPATSSWASGSAACSTASSTPTTARLSCARTSRRSLAPPASSPPTPAA